MKKLMIAAVAASVAATGFAGSYAAPAASKPAVTANTYVELAGGYAKTDFDKFGLVGDAAKHKNGGFAGGIDAGYTFMPHLGVEAGFMMPFEKAEGTIKGAKVSMRQYSFYGAARIDANVGDGFNVFLLGGVGYTHTKQEVANVADVSNSSFGFVGGFGADYAVADGFTVGAKYLRFAGNNEVAKGHEFPAPQYFLITLGYQINM